MTSNQKYVLRHPDTQHMMKFFDFRHLPPQLQVISAQVSHLAESMADQLPDDPELTAGLRKLLEAKDCFVRAAVDPGPVSLPGDR